jgi:hypothetical protein
MNGKTLVSGVALGLAAAGTLTACSKPAPPEWTRITTAEPGEAPTFYLDTANVSRKGGTPYVILQTRYADGRYGLIRAEANCAMKKLEPTALKEDLYSPQGAKLENRMTPMSGEDEQAVLARVCVK